MITSLPRHPQPEWLSKTTHENIKETFSLENVLRESLFYPGSGLDPFAIHHFAGHVHSFVFADCSVKESDLTKWVNGMPMDLMTPLGHYSPVASALIEDHDLSPDFCWDPENRKLGRFSMRAQDFVSRFRHAAGSPVFDENCFSNPDAVPCILQTEMDPRFFLLEKSLEDFSPSIAFLKRRWAYLMRKAEILSRHFEPLHAVMPTFARFFVMEKTDTAPGDLPDRISLLFLGEIAELVYDALYVRRGIAPGVLLIHNEKNFHGDNRAWSAPDPIPSALAESVMSASVLPETLAWKLYQEPCDWGGWEEFSSVALPDQYRGDAPLRLMKRTIDTSCRSDSSKMGGS